MNLRALENGDGWSANIDSLIFISRYLFLTRVLIKLVCMFIYKITF